MVKERRAFGVKAISDTPSTKELQVSNAPIVNLDAALQADFARAGTKLNPLFFQNLADVSSDIHTTRRHGQNMDFYTALNQQRNDDQFIITQAEQIGKLQVANYVADQKSWINAQYQDARKKAEMDPSASYTEEVAKLHKRFSDEYNKLESPMAQESMLGFLDQKRLEEERNGVADDFAKQTKIAQVRAAQLISENISHMVVNKDIGIDQAVENMGTALVDVSTVIPYADFKEQLDKGYNAVILTQAREYVNAVKLGDKTPEEGRAAIMDLIDTYRRRDIQVGDKTFHTALSSEGVSALLSSMGEMKRSGSDLKIYTSIDGYKNLVADPSYYASATIESAREDFSRNILPIWQAALTTGDKSHLDHACTMTKLFLSEVAPKVASRNMLIEAKEKLRTLGPAKKALGDTVAVLHNIHTRLQRGEDIDLANVPELLQLSKDGLTMQNFGLPFLPTDTLMVNYTGKSNEDFHTIKTNYVSNLIKAINTELSRSNMDLLIDLDPNVREADAQVRGTVDYSSLVVENREENITTVNVTGIENAAAAMRNKRIAVESAAGTSYIVKATVDDLDVINQQLQFKNPDQKDAFFRAYATAAQKAGIADSYLIGLNGISLTSEQKETLSDLQTAIFLTKDSYTLNALADIHKAKVAGALNGLTPTTLDIYAKDKVTLSKGALTASDEIQTLMYSFEIPGDQQDAVRNMMMQWVASRVKGPAYTEHGGDTFDLRKEGVDLLSKLFTKHGIWKGSTLYQQPGMTEERVDSIVESAQNYLQQSMKALKIQDADIKATVNPVNGKVTFTNHGRKILVPGTDPTMPGSDLIPFSFNLGDMPAGMTQEDYDKCIRTTLQIAGTMIALDNSELLDEGIEKWSKMVKGKENLPSKEELDTLRIQILNQISSGDFMRQYAEYMQGGYSGTDVVPMSSQALSFFSSAAGISEVIDPGLTGQGLERYKSQRGGGEYATEFTRMLNFINTTMSNDRVVPLNTPTALAVAGGGFNYKGISQRVTAHGWNISSFVGGKDSKTGRGHNPKGLHPLRRAIDIYPLNGYNSLRNPNGSWNEEKVLAHLQEVQSWGASRVITGWNEWKDIAKRAGLKNEKGQVFVGLIGDNDPELKEMHQRHDHVEFPQELVTDKTSAPRTKITGELNKKPYVATKEEYLKDTAQTLMSSFPNKFQLATANILAEQAWDFEPTKWDAENTGRSLDDLNQSAYNRAIAYAARYVRGVNAIGNPTVAMAALQGKSIKCDYQDIASYGPGTKIEGAMLNRLNIIYAENPDNLIFKGFKYGRKSAAAQGMDKAVKHNVKYYTNIEDVIAFSERARTQGLIPIITVDTREAQAEVQAARHSARGDRKNYSKQVGGK